MREFLGRGPQECFEKSRRSCQAQQALAEAQQNHAKWVDEVAQAEQRLIALQTEAATPCAAMEQDSPHRATELQKLREKVNELQIQNRELQGSCKRQAVGMSTSGDRQGPHLKEDFVPGCDEDIRRWMRDRQADIFKSNHGRQCSRGGTIVPRDGLRQSPCRHRWFPTQSSPVTRRVLMVMVDFGQFRLRPILTSANFDFGQLFFFF